MTTIVNLGLGVDSVAMLVGLRAAKRRPDHIVFADTGSEKPETYDYLPVLNAWLQANSFPLVSVVSRRPGRAGYSSLEENCLTNETLPSLAFGFKSCSLKWKAAAIDDHLLGTRRRPGVLVIERGEKPLKLIGYDSGPRDSKRAVDRTEDEHFRYAYPLREWGWARERCVAEIKAEGLPVPVKSACFFCPASKPWELMWLAAKHPRLFMRALAMEDHARNGRHGLHAVRGLWGRDRPGRPGSWRKWAENEGIVLGNDIVADKAELIARAMQLKPAIEANDSMLSCNDTDLVQISHTPHPQLTMFASEPRCENPSRADRSRRHATLASTAA